MADSLTGILSLLQAFSSKTGTTTQSGGTNTDSGSTTTQNGGTTTNTKQTVLSQDTMNAMLKSAMEGTTGSSGLADIVSGQNKAGLYNSSTNSMLTNDLLSRLATQVAVAGAPTVTTQANPVVNTVVTPSTKTTGGTTGTTTTPAAISPTTGLTALAGVAGLSAAKPFIDKVLGTAAAGTAAKSVAATKKLTLSSGASSVGADMPGDASSQSAESVLSMAGENSSATADYLNSTVTESSGGVAEDIVSGEASSYVAESAADIAAPVVDAATEAAAAPVLEAISNTAEEALGGVVEGITGELAGSLAESAGTGITEALGTTIGDSFVEYGGNAMAEAAAAEATSVAAAEGGGSILGSFCFLTTAVCEYQQKPDNCPELDILRKFRDTWLQDNHPADIELYYRTAPDLVVKLKALPQAPAVFDEMYYGFILPAIRSIKQGKMEDAYRTYKNLYNYCVGA